MCSQGHCLGEPVLIALLHWPGLQLQPEAQAEVPEPQYDSRKGRGVFPSCPPTPDTPAVSAGPAATQHLEIILNSCLPSPVTTGLLCLQNIPHLFFLPRHQHLFPDHGRSIFNILRLPVSFPPSFKPEGPSRTCTGSDHALQASRSFLLHLEQNPGFLAVISCGRCEMGPAGWPLRGTPTFPPSPAQPHQPCASLSQRIPKSGPQDSFILLKKHWGAQRALVYMD